MKTKYFKGVLTVDELKRQYRKLAKSFHPDMGGSLLIMQMINREYYHCLECIGKIPESLRKVEIGNTVYVNNSVCVVTAVEEEVFRARSLATKRETYFSKSTGYAMLNFKYKASISLTTEL